MKKISLLVLTIAMFVTTANAQFDGYRWKTINATGSYSPREETDFVNVKGLFYLIGGRKIQEIAVYDPTKSSWSAASKPPIELHHFQAVVYKDEIYLVGAMTANYPHEVPVENIYIYTPATDKWRVGGTIPADRRRGSSGVAIYKNKFYITSGIIDGHWTGNVPWFDEYDPKTDKWTKLPDAPTARDHARAAIIGNKLYCIGGVQSDAMEKKGLQKIVSQIDIYDFKTGEWTVSDTKLTIPRAGNTTIVVGDEILVIGGESAAQKVAHNEMDAYNVKTGEFRKLPPMVQGRHAFGSVYNNGKIYSVAGVGNAGGSPLLNTIEVFSKD